MSRIQICGMLWILSLQRGAPEADGCELHSRGPNPLTRLLATGGFDDPLARRSNWDVRSLVQLARSSTILDGWHSRTAPRRENSLFPRHQVLAEKLNP